MMVQTDKIASAEAVLATAQEERKERAILKLWDTAALIDDQCARTMVLWTINYLAESLK